MEFNEMTVILKKKNFTITKLINVLKLRAYLTLIILC
jgi:hypothetical protein